MLIWFYNCSVRYDSCKLVKPLTSRLCQLIHDGFVTNGNAQPWARLSNRRNVENVGWRRRALKHGIFSSCWTPLIGDQREDWASLSLRPRTAETTWKNAAFSWATQWVVLRNAKVAQLIELGMWFPMKRQLFREDKYLLGRESSFD